MRVPCWRLTRLLRSFWPTRSRQKKLSVREAEKMATRANMSRKDGKSNTKPAKSRDLLRLEETLSDALATTVSIKLGARNSGEVVISFTSLDQLDQITALLHQKAH